MTVGSTPVPGFRYNAPATLDFGGAWVTTGIPARDILAQDLVLLIDGQPLNASAVALTRSPELQGRYLLAWTAPVLSANQTLSLSVGAGALASPLHGSLGAYAASVVLTDCLPPTITTALLVRSSNHQCVDASAPNCPFGGAAMADAVIVIDFSEQVGGSGEGGAVSSADLQVYIEGGRATVASTFDAYPLTTRRQLFLRESASRLMVGMVLSGTPTGSEIVRLRPRPRALTDAAGWAASDRDKDVVSALGSVLEPFADTAQAAPRSPVSTEDLPVLMLIGGGIGCVVLLLLLLVCIRSRGKKRKRGHPSIRRRSRRVEPAPSDAALTIATRFPWLRPTGEAPQAKRPGDEGRRAALCHSAAWLDLLADDAAAQVAETPPECSLDEATLAAAHAAYQHELGETQPGQETSESTIDDLTALRALERLLDTPPAPLPLELVVAAASIDTSAAAALLPFTEKQAAEVLQSLIDEGAPLPRQVAEAADARNSKPDAAGTRTRRVLANMLSRAANWRRAVAVARSLAEARIADDSGGKEVDTDPKGSGRPSDESGGISDDTSEPPDADAAAAWLDDTAGDEAAVDAMLDLVAMHTTAGERLQQVEQFLLQAVTESAATTAHAPSAALAACREIFDEMIVRRLARRGVGFFTGSLPFPALATEAGSKGGLKSNGEFASVRADVVIDTEAAPPLRRLNSMGRGTFDELAKMRASFRLSERAAGRSGDPNADDYDADGVVQQLVHFGEHDQGLEGPAPPDPADLIPMDLEHRSAPAPLPAAGVALPPAASADATLAAVSTSAAPHRLPPVPPANTKSKGKQIIGFVPAPQGREAPERPAAMRGAIAGKLALPPVGSGGKVALLPVRSLPVLDGQAPEGDPLECDFPAPTATSPGPDAVNEAAAPADAPPATVPARHSSSPTEELPPPQQEPWRAASEALFEEMKEQRVTGQLPT